MFHHISETNTIQVKSIQQNYFNCILYDLHKNVNLRDLFRLKLPNFSSTTESSFTQLS